jgi:hypothetical protein
MDSRYERPLATVQEWLGPPTELHRRAVLLRPEYKRQGMWGAFAPSLRSTALHSRWLIG